MTYTTLGNFQLVEIYKPMNSTDEYDVVGVDVRQFEKAKRNGRFVLVRTPNGERVFMPKHVQEFKKIKKVYLYPDNPMIEYSLVIPHCEKKDNDYYSFSPRFA